MKNVISVIVVLALAGVALFGYFNYLTPATPEEIGFKAPVVKKEKSPKAQVEALVKKMANDGMEDVMKVLPDLAVVKDVPKDSDENLSGGMSEETLMYSAEHNLSVVVCDMMNTPAYVFEGESWTPGELEKAKMMMKEMIEMMKEDEGMDEETEGEAEMNEEPAAEVETNAAVYTDYSADAVPQGQAYVVYFHADWCPSCVKVNKDLNEGLEEMPEGAIILKANFDAETELKIQYGVTGQHTAVMINDDGSVAGVKQGFSVEDLETFFAS